MCIQELEYVVLGFKSVREYMNHLGDEFKRGLIVCTGGAELNLLESISRTIVSEFSKDCGVVPVEMLRGN